MTYPFPPLKIKFCKYIYILPVFLLAYCTLALGQQAEVKNGKLDSFYDQADSFLAKYVSNGEVAYQSIQQNPRSLNKLVNIIGNVSFKNTSDKQKKAFYINAYNILTIYGIIEHGIPSSPMDVNGFFDDYTYLVAGKEKTLDDIEKGILLPTYKDARIHFAVVCAARGCPELRPWAYKPSTLDEQLTQSAVETLNNDYFIRVHEGVVEVSEIFKWYKQDFLREADSVITYINQYRSNKIPTEFNLAFYKYDWSLNAVES